MTDLERYRDEIDEIDSEIVRLFEKRMKVSEEVAEYKIKTGKQVLDPARESQKIHTLKEKAHGDFNSLGVQELFSPDHGYQPQETIPAAYRTWNLRRT